MIPVEGRESLELGQALRLRVLENPRRHPVGVGGGHTAGEQRQQHAQQQGAAACHWQHAVERSGGGRKPRTVGRSRSRARKEARALAVPVATWQSNLAARQLRTGWLAPALEGLGGLRVSLAPLQARSSGMTERKLAFPMHAWVSARRT